MLEPMKTLAQKVAELRHKRGWTQGDLAAAVGVSQGSIGNIESGIRTNPRAATVLGIAKALGVSPQWLQSDDGEMLPTPVPTTSNISPSPGYAPGEAIVRVPVLANAGSMGTGNDLLHDDVLVGQIDLSEQWLSRRIKPTSPQALRFVHAYGDSMSPTFEDGDVLLVDTGMRDPRHIDGVYVLSASDRLYIKRVQSRLDGTTEISSDNPAVKTVDVLNGGNAIDVLGRVVWCWNGRKL